MASITPAEEKEIKAFFEVYDPERLGKNFDILKKYVQAKGMAALEEKLLKKYGANIQTMREVKRKGMSGDFTKAVPPPVKKRVDNDYPTSEEDLPRMPTLKSPPSSAPEGIEEMSELPPPPPPMSGSYDPPAGNRYSAVSGINPFTGKPDNEARLDLFEKVSKFYQRFNPSRLNKGIGALVDYALNKGEEKLNSKLMKEYGYDLNTFDELQKEEARELELKRMSQMKEEADKSKNDLDSDKSLREELTQFFLRYDPSRAEMKMDVLMEFVKRRGRAALNEKMFNKYGADLDTFAALNDADDEQPQETLDNGDNIKIEVTIETAPISKVDSFEEYFEAEEEKKPVATLTPQEKEIMQAEFEKKKLKTLRPRIPFQIPSYTKSQLEKYFAKYEPRNLSNGGVEAVYQWTQRNGMALLNEKLLQKYGMSLQDFNEEANLLRDDLIEFYRVVDRNKLVTGCEQVLNWGLKNGRAALNVKFMEKYGMTLQDAEENFDSISQV
mmetsp:Transcript_3402/g.3858  ORF Transcript_3402/g.3858 Transcript_3402/m.3858 type:complete len:497 (-) Transcript_3402:275-1765(-)|eukprot:CAMPEP_0184006714 /NCGR_PEP_ID=MMETSP0954-20121128/864_1 /TAXON_ID=627963 /ORGANISM="Aplanochytrium sp, Strain PBS07" /LENGTH=496 /DNA_ID=CAMNT_0026285329 /DNA_START=301 /DNA_END=1791 /DNA_ORIENTATION=-